MYFHTHTSVHIITHHVPMPWSEKPPGGVAKRTAKRGGGRDGTGETRNGKSIKQMDDERVRNDMIVMLSVR